MPKSLVAWVGCLWFIAVIVLGCGTGTGSRHEESVATQSAALTIVAQHDFEDGTLKGWIPRGPVTLTNTTEAAADGTRSLKTTGRTAGFHGPSLNVLGVLTRGATYEISVKARLVAGEAPTTMRMTMQQTPTGGSQQFITVAQNRERDRRGVGDADRDVLVRHRRFGLAPLRRGDDRNRLLLHRLVHRHRDDSAARRQHSPRLRGRHDPGLDAARRWRRADEHDRSRGRRHAQPQDHGSDGGFQRSEPERARRARARGDVPGDAFAARLVAGEAATTLRVTMQRTPAGRRAARSIRYSRTANVTDAAWVTMTGLYSFATDVTALLALRRGDVARRRRTTSTSFSIDRARARRPVRPATRLGAASQFESGTPEGWFARTGAEVRDRERRPTRTAARSSLLTTGPNQRLPRPGLQRHQRDVQRLALPRLAVGEARAGPGRHAASREPGAPPRHTTRRRSTRSSATRP